MATFYSDLQRPLLVGGIGGPGGYVYGDPTFSYNGDGTVSSIAWSEGGTTSFSYNPNGTVATVVDSVAGTTTSFSYNPDGTVDTIVTV